MLDLSVVIVNYNNLRVLKACLSSLMPALKGIDAEVILSDNGSHDNSLAWVRQYYPTIHILENGANLGFAEANNRAFAIARGRFILMLNPDTVVFDNTPKSMLAFMMKSPRAGATGCRLLNPDGSRQISARTFPTLLTYALQFSGLSYRFPKNRFCGRFNMTYLDGQHARSVDWVCGAVLMFRREIIEQVGVLDPYFFLTYDEVDFCHRIKDAGYAIWYIPDGQIIHLDRQSEPQSNPHPEARMKYLTVERNSRVRYFRKHHSLVYAALVESLHFVMSALFLIKVRLLGTRQSTVSVMEKRLQLRLFWRTALQIPRACWAKMIERDSAARGRSRFHLFTNPYLANES